MGKHRKTYMDRMVKQHEDQQTRIYAPTGIGTIDLPGYNYKDLPDDDPRRVHIESMLSNLPPPPKRTITSVYADKVKQRRRRA